MKTVYLEWMDRKKCQIASMWHLLLQKEQTTGGIFSFIPCLMAFFAEKTSLASRAGCHCAAEASARELKVETFQGQDDRGGTRGSSDWKLLFKNYVRVVAAAKLEGVVQQVRSYLGPERSRPASPPPRKNLSTSRAGDRCAITPFSERREVEGGGVGGEREG